jgi:hypothetical protein
LNKRHIFQNGIALNTIVNHIFRFAFGGCDSKEFQHGICEFAVV